MNVVNFGSLNIDHVYAVDHFCRAGETIHTKSYTQNAGGKGLNQSVALARAGVETWHAGLIGPEGHFLKETLDRAGVHTRFVEESAGSTGHAIIQVDSTGQNSILLHDGANGRLTPDFVTAVLDLVPPMPRSQRSRRIISYKQQIHPEVAQPTTTCSRAYTFTT